MVKLITSLGLILLSSSIANASCGEPQEDLRGKFEILSIKKGSAFCAPKGKLTLPGCVFEVKALTKSESKTDIRVYSNPELCSLKPKQVVEMVLKPVCCDQIEDLECKDFKNSAFDIQRADAGMACTASAYYFVQEYHFSKKGKSIVRTYDSKERKFTESPPSAIQDSKRKNK